MTLSSQTKSALGFAAALGVLCVVMVELDIEGMPPMLYAPDMPGDQPNPALVTIFNEELAALERDLPGAGDRPEPLPGAADDAHRWLAEVREVVTHCRMGASYRLNTFQYDLTLRSGEVLEDVHASSDRCDDRRQTPMRARFEAGRVVQVQTDGRERGRPLEELRADIALYARALVRQERKAHPERSFKRASLDDPR